jgi:hypothetical protein
VPDPSRWRMSRRLTFSGAGSQVVYETLNPGDVLNVRQVTVSTDAAAEVVVFYGNATAERLIETRAIRAAFLGANGGAAPDLDCIGAWSPSPGLPIRVYASAACVVWVGLEGVVE